MLVSIDTDPDVVAAIVCLDFSDRLSDCLDSLSELATDRRISVLCVINSAADISPEWFKPGVEYIITGLNLGWGGGLQLARTKHHAPYMWLIQDDMVVNRDCLDSLLSAMESDPGLGAVSPVVVDPNGLTRPGSFGSKVNSDGEIERWDSTPFNPAELEIPADIGYVPSRGMLVRTSIWDDVGGYDPSFYPVVWADVDFCTGLNSRGWRFKHVIDARVQHLGQGSTPRHWGEFLFHRNSQLYRAKWLGVEAARDTAGVLSVDDSQLNLVKDSTTIHAAIGKTIPSNLLIDTARNASNAFLHLAKTYDQEKSESLSLIHRLQEEVTELREEAAILTTADETHRREQALLETEFHELTAKFRRALRARNRARRELHNIKNSRTWQVTSPLRRVSMAGKRLVAKPGSTDTAGS